MAIMAVVVDAPNAAAHHRRQHAGKGQRHVGDPTDDLVEPPRRMAANAQWDAHQTGYRDGEDADV
jgi:hypothetical protein